MLKQDGEGGYRTEQVSLDNIGEIQQQKLQDVIKDSIKVFNAFDKANRQDVQGFDLNQALDKAIEEENNRRRRIIQAQEQNGESTQEQATEQQEEPTQQKQEEEEEKREESDTARETIKKKENKDEKEKKEDYVKGDKIVLHIKKGNVDTEAEYGDYDGKEFEILGVNRGYIIVDNEGEQLLINPKMKGVKVEKVASVESEEDNDNKEESTVEREIKEKDKTQDGKVYETEYSPVASNSYKERYKQGIRIVKTEYGEKRETVSIDKTDGEIKVEKAGTLSSIKDIIPKGYELSTEEMLELEEEAKENGEEVKIRGIQEVRISNNAINGSYGGATLDVEFIDKSSGEKRIVKSIDIRIQKSTKKESETELKKKLQDWLSNENLEWAEGRELREINEKFGNELEPIATIPDSIRKIFSSLDNNYLWSGKGYFIDHAVNHHPELEKEDYNNIQTVLNEFDDIKDLSNSKEGINKIAVVKKLDKGYAVVIELSKENDKIVLHKTFFYKDGKGKRLPFENKRSLLNELSVDGSTTINPTNDSSRQTPNISTLDNSDSKGSTNLGTTQAIGRKSLGEKIKDGSVYDNGEEQTYDDLLDELENEEDVETFINNNISNIKTQITKAKKTKTTDIDKIKQAREKIRTLEQQQDYWEKVLEVKEKRKRDEQIKEVEEENKRKKDQKKIKEKTEQENKTAEQERIVNNSGIGGIRQRYEQSKKVEGFKGSKVLPNGEKVKGRYVLVESTGITASHDVNKNFAQSEGFPTREDGTTLNDRDYEKDKQAQGQVRQRATSYDGRAVTDMPIIDNNGIVLSGNDRTMSGQLSAQENMDGAYIESLRENAQMYGFTEEDVEGMQHPRLVFVLDENMDYTTENFAKFNQNEKKTQNNIEKAVKIGKTIKAESVKKIAQVIDEYESIAECLSDSKGVKRIIDILDEDGQIQRNDVAQYMNEDVFNEAGKEYIQTVLIGATLSEDSVRMINTMPFMKKTVITALNQILQNAKLESYSLQEEINEAIKVVYEAHKQVGIKQGESLDLYYRQMDLFSGESNIKSRTIEMLADLLNDEKVKELKKILSLYNEEAQLSLSGNIDIFSTTGKVKSKEEILEEIIKNKKDYEQRKRNRQSVAVGSNNTTKSDNGRVDGGKSRDEQRRSERESVGDSEGRDEQVEEGKKEPTFTYSFEGRQQDDFATVVNEYLQQIDKPLLRSTVERGLKKESKIELNGEKVTVGRYIEHCLKEGIEIEEKQFSPTIMQFYKWAKERYSQKEEKQTKEPQKDNKVEAEDKFKEFIQETDTKQRTTISKKVSKKDIENANIPLDIDGKGSPISIYEIIPSSITEDSRLYATYKGFLDENGKEKWQEMGDAIDEWNKDSEHNAFDIGDTGLIGFRTIDEAIAFYEWIEKNKISSERVENEDIEEINKRFNEELDSFARGEMRSSDKFHLGEPNEILRACGLNAGGITMTQSVLQTHLKKHGLTTQEIKDLPKAIQNPIMVYEWGTKAKNTVVITSIERGNERITISIRLNKNGKGLEVNEISSVHGKSVERLMNEITTEKSDFGKENLKYVDKEKVFNWFAMETPKVSSQNNQRLNSVAKVLQNFENPKIKSKKKAESVLKKEEQQALTEGITEVLGNAIGKENVITDNEEAQRVIEEHNKGVKRENIANNIHDAFDFRQEVQKIIGIDNERRVPSAYYKGTSDTGTTYEIRVSNHIARFDNFENHNETLPEKVISIVFLDEKFDRTDARFESADEVNERLDKEDIECEYEQIIIDDIPNKTPYEIQKAIESIELGTKLLKERGVLLFEDDSTISYHKKDNGKIKEHRVYHGSPYEFTEFDHSKMGTGEGAQAFGWGSYVTEVEGIGKSYAESNRTTKTILRVRTNNEWKEYDQDIWHTPLGTAGGYYTDFDTKQEALHQAELGLQIRREWGKLYGRDKKYFEEVIEIIKSHNKSDFQKIVKLTDRNLYTVDIPEDNGNNYLYWDKPVNDNIISKIQEYLKENYRKSKLEEFNAGILAKSSASNKEEVEAWQRRGENVYKMLIYLLGEPKEVSKALNSMGLTGISYPANAMSGGREDGARNFVIFNEQDLKITDHIKFFKTKNGQAYGFTVNGKVYIDTKIAKASTPIHEYTHLWAEALRQSNPKEWKNIVELMKKEKYLWDKVRRMYPELQTEDEIADEVLAHYSGKRGAELLEEEAKKIKADGKQSVFDKARALQTIENVKKALARFWKGVADFFNIHFTSAEEVADKVLSDMLNGVNPNDHIARGNNKTNALKDNKEYTTEEQSIIEKAKKDGTYVKAPNGKNTNLTERQWVQVRTKAFKEWFGDWEKKARIDKLRKSKSIEITGKEIPVSKDITQYKKNAQEYGNANLRGEYTNKDTGKKISLGRKGIKEVLHHDYKDIPHIQSIVAIPQIIENSIYIDTIENEDSKNPNVKSFDYYVCGLKINGEDYTVKAVISNMADGSRYYDHKLTQIEKGKLLDGIEENRPNGERITSPLRQDDFGGKDTRLFSILQDNSSKVVDENGEPLVVYHGTDVQFTSFDPKEMRDSEGSFFFAENKEDAESYAYEIPIMEVFINIKKPFNYENDTVPEDYQGRWENAENKREQVGILKELGYDGWIGDFENGKGWGEISAFNPNQIKSATDNIGTFDKGNNDIRYQFIGEQEAERREREIDEALEDLDVEERKVKKGILKWLNDSVVTTFADDYHALRKMEDEVVRQMRKKIPGFRLPYSVYEQQIASKSATEGQIFLFTEQVFKPLLNKVREIAKKNKAIEWVSRQRSTSAEATNQNNNLDSVAKIVQNFENPQKEGGFFESHTQFEKVE